MSSPLPVRVRPGPAELFRLGPGGSAWTYVDWIDEDGDGLVLIAAHGLPFLPGYASAARSGRPEDPLAHPAVVLSTIRGGRPDFYAFHRGFGPDRVWAVLGDGRLSLRADLRGTLPGCDWEARIEIDGVLRVPSADEPASADHEWTVLTVGARAEAEIRVNGQVGRLAGRAYVDRNLCTGPLEAAGLRDWHWGRAALPDGDVVWYGTSDGVGSAIRLAADGTTTDLGPVRTSGVRSGRWGLPRPAVVHLPGLDLPLDRPVDDGPFYTRVLLRHGERAVGFAEACRVDRIDGDWMRPLVRMAVADPAGSSRWLPLFSGPRAGRLGRLLRSVGR